MIDEILDSLIIFTNLLKLNIYNELVYYILINLYNV